MQQFGLLSILPREILVETLLRGDVLHLLRLRQSGNSPITSILYLASFWEEYCSGRGQEQPTPMWHHPQRISSHMLNMHRSPGFVFNLSECEDTSKVANTRAYSWEMVAIIHRVKKLIISGILNYHPYETVYKELSIMLRGMMPQPCLAQLAHELVEMPFIEHQQGTRTAYAAAHMNNTHCLGSGQWQEAHITQHVSQPLRITQTQHTNIEDGDVLNTQALIPSYANSATVDVQASRKALKELYEQDKNRKIQSRSGWGKKR